MKPSKQNISTFLAILFHVSGLIGILFTPYKEWFIQNTPVNLCLMVLLLVWNQQGKKLNFFFFFLIAFMAGMGSEMIGVNTGKLFGQYKYGSVLGPQLNGVPYLIGLNWFVLVLCSGTIMMKIHNWVKYKFETEETVLSPKMELISLVADGALLAAFFDWIMEPVAVKLGFWKWSNQVIPAYNYVCWFLISAFLLWTYRRLTIRGDNHFAVHLFIIQLLFFLALQTYLS